MGDDTDSMPIEDPGEARRETRYLPSDIAERERRSQRLLLLVVRLFFMVMLVTVTLLPFVGAVTEQGTGTLGLYLPVLIATFTFGVIVLIVDARVPNKRLAPVFAVYMGVVAGLVGALAIGTLIDLVAESWDLRTPTWLAWLNVVKLGIGVTLCYLAVSIVLTTKDDFRLVIPYVEFAKQVRGVRPMLVDSSALIDGRIDGLGQTGFIDAPLIIPQFVIDELQLLADNADKTRRSRGRRGLSVVSQLQANAFLDVSIDTTDPRGHGVDHMLLRLGREQNLRILTTDYNLNKVAEIQGVTVLNINDLSNAVKSQAIPGEVLSVEIVKAGEGDRQGVGYMPDGTMVVVEGAAECIGETVSLTVTNLLQTSAGRMVFGRTDEPAPRATGMADAATHQPRATERPDRKDRVPTRRNPRR